MRVGHLFAGIDGLGLGLPDVFETAWFSEYEDAPSRVLAHHYPDVPNHGDITAVDWSEVAPVDVLTGGFPCQDISKAGRGAGIKEGTRSGLWFEYVRAIRDLRPGLVIVENVATLLRRGVDVVLGDLAEAGFDAWWTSLRASDVGAAHRRERIFIVAVTTDGDVLRHLHREARQHPAEARIDALRHAPTGRHEDASDGDLPRLEGRGSGRGRSMEEAPDQAEGGRDHLFGLGQPGTPGGSGPDRWGEWWPAIARWERTLGRRAPDPVGPDGEMTAEFVEWHMGFPAGWTSILTRNERLKALGNAVVPQCGALVGRWALDLVDAALARQEVA